MTIPAVDNAAYPSPDELRDLILRSIKLSFQRRGLTANVLPGSDHFIRADGFSKPLSIAIANNKISLTNFSPLTATGDALVELAGVYGVSKRPSQGASGFVSVKVTGTAVIPQGYQGTSANGHKYKTTVVSTVTTAGDIEVQSTETGTSTNQSSGAIITWDSASVANLAATATVNSGALDGGTDDEDDETLRTRLLERLAFPAVGANWSQIKQLAEQATSSVEQAYVYQAVRGPGSLDIAVTAKGGDRTLSPVVISQVSAYVSGKLPGYASLNVTPVSAQLVDVVINAELALPTVAGGAGGGWRDAVPWPNTITKVTAYNSTNSTITVDSTAQPVPGNHIGMWNPATLTMNEYVVATVGGSIGSWTVTVQGGFGFDPTSLYVSAGAFNLTNYATTALAKIQGLGPGEKSISIDVIPRGLRKPPPDISGLADLTSLVLSAISNDHPEILDLAFAARRKAGLTDSLTRPDVTATTADPPNILVLNSLAFISE